MSKGNVLLVATSHSDFGKGKKTGADTIEIGEKRRDNNSLLTNWRSPF